MSSQNSLPTGYLLVLSNSALDGLVYALSSYPSEDRIRPFNTGGSTTAVPLSLYRIGYLQAVRLLDELNDFDPSCHAWMMCGDFNAAPSDEIVRLIRARGFLDAYGDAPEPFTCVTKTGGKRVDYLFHLPTLSSRPMALPAISGTTLPNDREPSDHLAVAAEFDWDAS